MQKFEKPLLIFLVCMLMAVTITMQLKIASLTESATSQNKVSLKLKDQILSLEIEKKELEDELKETEKVLSSTRSDSAQRDSSLEGITSLIKKYEFIAGTTDVCGQGVQIAYTATKKQYKNDIAVDLRDIVNELRNIGAEAIEINGKRIVNSTSIEVIQNKITINGENFDETFEIKAIGNAELIFGGLTRPGGIIENIKESGIQITINKKDKVDISRFVSIS